MHIINIDLNEWLMFTKDTTVLKIHNFFPVAKIYENILCDISATYLSSDNVNLSLKIHHIFIFILKI